MQVVALIGDKQLLTAKRKMSISVQGLIPNKKSPKNKAI